MGAMVGDKALVRLIFDYSHMYYKYKFKLEKGMLKTLTFNGRDISKIYYSLRDIEGARRKYEEAGYTVSVHVCMDSKTERKNENCEYKANRENKLNENEYDDMEDVRNMLLNVGYNVIKVDGYEADDIIYTLVNSFDMSDKCVIYTNDSDILINVKDNVSVDLYNSHSGTQYVSMNNFEQFTRNKFKSEKFKYNMIMLYKALVGDKSDNVSGIFRFGVKAFDKFVSDMEPYIVGCEANFINPVYTNAVIMKASKIGVLKPSQTKEALESLAMVKPRVVEELGKQPNTAIYCGSYNKRVETYGKYGMQSLYE